MISVYQSAALIQAPTKQVYFDSNCALTRTCKSSVWIKINPRCVRLNKCRWLSNKHNGVTSLKTVLQVPSWSQRCAGEYRNVGFGILQLPVYVCSSHYIRTYWSLYVPPSLTCSNSKFCPHSVFMCFLWIWKQTATESVQCRCELDSYM
jgi:hypothetical protein